MPALKNFDKAHSLNFLKFLELGLNIHLGYTKIAYRQGLCDFFPLNISYRRTVESGIFHHVQVLFHFEIFHLNNKRSK